MGGARGLFASLGASISFVAGAALSLLAVTCVFANHVSTGVPQGPQPGAVFVEERSPAPSGAPAPGANAVVVRAAAAPASASKHAASVGRRRSESHAMRVEPAVSQMRQPTAVADVTDLGPVATPPAPTPSEARPTTGDGVREVGDALSATVQGTAGATDAVSAPLGPPVSQAVQNALDIVTSLLHGATATVGHAVDATLPRR
jgi:hypothetical protein